MLLLAVPADHPAFWIAPVVALALLLFVLFKAANALSPTGERDAVAGVGETSTGKRQLPVVVLNPSKFADADEAKALITQECLAYGWGEPVFIETTEEDSGKGQAEQAVEMGADCVMACGGDGTVRLVAQVLSGTDIPMGVLPAGTGNLLARNLDVPLDDVSAAVRVALSGQTRAIDMGWVKIDDDEEVPFLVMAGMGFDGEIMANTDGVLKDKVGAAAYVAAGAQRLNGKRTRVRIAADEKVVTRRVRSVIVGNCGRLQAGIELIPDAVLDDGMLDVMALTPRGVVGWGAISLAVLTKQHKGHAPVEHAQGERVDVWAQQPLTAQVDGDAIGDATRMRARLDKGALLVRAADAEGDD